MYAHGWIVNSSHNLVLIKSVYSEYGFTCCTNTATKCHKYFIHRYRNSLLQSEWVALYQSPGGGTAEHRKTCIDLSGNRTNIDSLKVTMNYFVQLHRPNSLCSFSSCHRLYDWLYKNVKPINVDFSDGALIFRGSAKCYKVSSPVRKLRFTMELSIFQNWDNLSGWEDIQVVTNHLGHPPTSRFALISGNQLKNPK